MPSTTFVVLVFLFANFPTVDGVTLRWNGISAATISQISTAPEDSTEWVVGPNIACNGVNIASVSAPAGNGSKMLTFANLGLGIPSNADIYEIRITFTWKANLVNYSQKPSLTCRLITDVNQWDGYFLELSDDRSFTAGYGSQYYSFSTSRWTPSMMNTEIFGIGLELNTNTFHRDIDISCVNISIYYDSIVTTKAYPLTTSPFVSTTMRATTSAVVSNQNQVRDSGGSGAIFSQTSAQSSDIQWQNIESVNCSGVASASVDMVPFKASSRITVTNFDFDIPIYATLNYADVTLTRRTLNAPSEMETSWIIGSGNNSTSKVVYSTWYPFNEQEVSSFSFNVNKWNATMLNSNQFYFGINFNKMPQINDTAMISCVKILVSYSLPSTTKPLTTARITSGAITSGLITSGLITSGLITSGALTTKSLTTQPGLTTSSLTTSELTTSKLTTKELTTSPLTTNELTTSELTTKQLTTSPLTTQELTTNELTTQPLSTAALTTSELTTSHLTTNNEPIDGVSTGDGDSISTGTSDSVSTGTSGSESTGTGAVDISADGESQSSDSDSRRVAIGVGVGVPAGLLIFGAFVGIFLHRRKQRRTDLDDLNLSNVEMRQAAKDVPPNTSSEYSGSLLRPADQKHSDENLQKDSIYTRIPSPESSPTASPNLSTEGALITPERITKETSWEINFEDLVVEDQIGVGAFGIVFKGKWRKTPVAIKKFLQVSEKAAKEFQQEIMLMRGLKYHVNVLQLYGFCMNPLTLVTEFVEMGSLWNYLQSSKPLSEEQQKKIIIGIARGMLHLHFEKICHRDLACRNVLLTAGFDPKISDFGLSRKNAEVTNTTASDIGPVRWMAYECLTERVYSEKSDVYAFGMTLMEFYTRKVPYPDMDAFQVATKIISGDLVPSAPKEVPANIAPLMNRCFARNPAERPSFDEICNTLEKVMSDI